MNYMDCTGIRATGAGQWYEHGSGGSVPVQKCRSHLARILHILRRQRAQDHRRRNCSTVRTFVRWRCHTTPPVTKTSATMVGLVLVFFLHDVFRCFFTQIVAKGRRPNVPAAALQTMPMRWWLHVGMEMAVTCNE